MIGQLDEPGWHNNFYTITKNEDLVWILTPSGKGAYVFGTSLISCWFWPDLRFILSLPIWCFSSIYFYLLSIIKNWLRVIWSKIADWRIDECFSSQLNTAYCQKLNHYYSLNDYTIGICQTTYFLRVQILPWQIFVLLCDLVLYN